MRNIRVTAQREKQRLMGKQKQEVNDSDKQTMKCHFPEK